MNSVLAFTVNQTTSCEGRLGTFFYAHTHKKKIKAFIPTLKQFQSLWNAPHCGEGLNRKEEVVRLVKGQSQNKDTKGNSSAVASGVFRRDFMGVGRRRGGSRTQEGKRQWGMAGNQPEWGGSTGHGGGGDKGGRWLREKPDEIFEYKYLKIL